MAAYIVGMITGAICMLGALVYVMFVSSIAMVLAQNEQFDMQQFQQAMPTGMLYAIMGVGAVVFLVSALMAAYSGVADRRAASSNQPQAPEGPHASSETAEKPGEIELD